MKTLWTLLMTIAAIGLAWPAMAQDVGAWDIQADVDGDGVVGPTDIQQVINGALGLNDLGPDAVNLPHRQYIVASPRASLAPIPVSVETNDAIHRTIGAVENFARPNGRLLVKAGTVVTFRYDRQVEGVWYSDACGLLRSVLKVEMRPIPVLDDTTGGDPAATAKMMSGGDGMNGNMGGPNGGGDQNGLVDDPALDNGDDPVFDGEDPASIEWTPIGVDGAEGKGCGPAVGTANIAVRHAFLRPGDYLVRSHVTTAAIPEAELVRDANATFKGAVRKSDVVLVHVRVIERTTEATQERWQWQENRNADTVQNQYGEGMRHELDLNVQMPGDMMN